MGTACFGGSFVPIVQYEKWEIHPVFPHFPYFRLCQNLSPNLLAPLCGAALEILEEFLERFWFKRLFYSSPEGIPFFNLILVHVNYLQGMNIYELHKYAKHNYTKWSLWQNDLYACIKQNGKERAKFVVLTRKTGKWMYNIRYIWKWNPVDTRGACGDVCTQNVDRLQRKTGKKVLPNKIFAGNDK